MQQQQQQKNRKKYAIEKCEILIYKPRLILQRGLYINETFLTLKVRGL